LLHSPGPDGRCLPPWPVEHVQHPLPLSVDHPAAAVSATHAWSAAARAAAPHSPTDRFPAPQPAQAARWAAIFDRLPAAGGTISTSPMPEFHHRGAFGMRGFMEPQFDGAPSRRPKRLPRRRTACLRQPAGSLHRAARHALSPG
jgi:hypothetical protein